MRIYFCNKVKLLIVFCICLTFVSCGGDNPTGTNNPIIVFEKNFGSSAFLLGRSVAQTSDGEYIVFGEKGDNLSSDIYLVKYDRNGEILWENTFGGNSEEVSRTVLELPGGGYILLGTSRSFSGTASFLQLYLVKTDNNGSLVWEKGFGPAVSNSICLTSDGGFIITASGENRNNLYIIKVDSFGNLVWEKTYLSRQGESITNSSDGNFIIAGRMNSDVYMQKIDSNGDSLWTKTYGVTDSYYNSSISQTTSGGFIVAGFIVSSSTNDYNMSLINTDSNGDTLWTKTFGGLLPDVAYSGIQTSDGGFIIVGYTLSTGAGSEDLYIIKTDGNGNEQWEKTFGTTGIEIGYDIAQTSDGGFIIIGRYQRNDIYLIKTDANGNVN